MSLVCNEKDARGVTLAPAEQDDAERNIAGDARWSGLSLPRQYRGDGLPTRSAAARTRAGKRRVRDSRGSDLNQIFGRPYLPVSCLRALYRLRR